MNPSKYVFELWTPAGIKTAEFNGMASNRTLTLIRNDTEDIAWRLDLNEVKRYARSINTTYQLLIQKGITEVRIRRGSVYLCGGQITYVTKSRSSTGDYLDIRARGFLDLFTDRYTADLVTYTAVDRCTLAAALITTSQGIGPNWDFGVTIGSVPTIGVYTWQMQSVRIKDALQTLSRLQLGFDFKFTADKVFNMYASLGTTRPDVIFQYPGNTKTLTSVGDATSIQNRIYLTGSGIGDSTAISYQVDETNTPAALSSQLNYKVHEKPVTLSAILDSTTLSDYGQAQFAAYGTPFDLPSIEYDGAVGPSVTDYGLGDYVTVQETDDPDTELNGLYRVEQIRISLDQEDNEDVKLSFGR